MLSIENNPPDPPCTRDISSSEILITDERASSDKLALPLQEVDLLFPKFSIRDYVFTARSNDIKRNWPFSLRSLELCLKHGVKDVLPPFQTIQSVRDQSFDKCLLDDNPLQKENITTDGKDYTGPTYQSSLASSDEVGLNETLVGGCTDPSLSISKEEDERSEEPNFSQSESRPVLDNQLKFSRKLTDSLLEPQEGTKVACEVELQKAESTSQFSSEKCRLIVKFGNSSDPAVAADTTTTCATLPESMASNVCPVCKTFSSSSNTTLNAHIDQCLSAESTPKWGANSKLIRHRIKPRKTRLMVDICATAPRCTLEELDRRNGRNWATSSSLTTQDSEVHTQVKKQKVSPVHAEDSGGEGAVYFDADGTKVRILSKFNDPPSVSKVPELARPGKRMKQGKRNKYLSKHMKRRHRTKNRKYLMLSPDGRTLSSKDVNLEMHGDQEESNGIAKNHNEEHLLQVRKAQGQVKPSDSGNLRQWVCSKRTGPLKKSRRGHQLAGYDFHVTRNMLTGNDQSCLNDPPVERNVCGSPLSSENLTASPESIQMQDLSFEVCATENMEPSLRAKKSHSPLCGAQYSDAAKRSIKPTQKNVDQISKGSSCLYDDLVPKPPKHIRNNYASLRKEMVVETCEDSVGTCDNFPDVSIRVPRVSQVPSSVGTRSASLRKNILPLNPCMHKSKFNVLKNVSSTGKSQARFKAKGRKMVVLPSESDEGDDVTSDHNLDQLGCSNSRKAGHKVDKAGNLLSSETLEHSQGKGLLKTSLESSTLSGQHSLPLDCERDLRQNINALSDEFVGKCVQPSTETQFIGKDNADGSSSQKLEENEFQKICSSPYHQSNLLQSVEQYVGPLYSAGMLTRSMETNLCGDQQMITSGNRHGIGRQETHVVMETACKLNQETSYSEVDPIPIPGPPGSFLPSPRDMGSEDLHGNSSLTTCRVQSSLDKHDLVDRDSSESPISTTSTISNSAPEGSPPKYSRQVLSITRVLKDDSSPGLFDAGMKPTLLDASSVPQTSNKVAETVLGGDNVNADLISAGKYPFSFKDDSQPCRCSRSISSGVGLNYQQSPLLKRRMASAMMQPIMGKQSSCNEIVRASNSNSRPEAYSIGNSSNVSSEEGFLPMSKVSMGCSPVKVSVDSAPKFPSRGDCDSNSPSASNPVLRLMGKNLMVVNKDEDMPMQSKEGHVSNGHPSSQYQMFSGVTLGKPQSQDLHYSSAVVPQGTPVLEQVFRRCYNVPSNFSSDINAVRPQMPLVVQAGCFPTEHASVTSGSTLEMHGTHGEYNVLTQQNRPKSRSDTPAGYTFQRRTAKSNVGSSKACSAPNSYKEIIIIDDTPENGAEMAVNVKYSNGLSRKHVCPVGMPGNYPTYTNPFPRYPSPSLGKSPVLQNVNFHPPNSRQPNANPVKWDYSSEDSRVMPQSSYMIPSPSTNHPRSVLYFSSSLS